MSKDGFALTIEQSTVLKAWGIILIAFHNFFHQLNPKFYENEFAFQEVIFQNHLNFVLENPFEIIRTLFSFYGHLGVSVFIVLSAYGLTIQYGGKSFGYIGFMTKRIFRLYPVFLIGILVHVLVIAWWRPESWFDWGLAYVAKLSLLTNFIPGLETKVSGPWWFFSFIVQYYIVFVVIDRLVEKGKFLSLVMIALFGWLCIYFIDPIVPIKFKFTVIGWLPEIALGTALAKGYWTERTSYLFIAALLVFAAGHFSREAWIFHSFAFSLMFIICAHKIIRISEASSLLHRGILLVGVLSFPLFATHGPLRYPFQKIFEFNDTWWFSIVMSVVFFGAAIIVAMLADRLNRKFTQVSARWPGFRNSAS